MLELILLQAKGSGGEWQQFVFLGLIGVVFYVFMIRPQQKKQKDQKKYTQEIKKGQLVVTLGGIHGKVAEVGDTTVTLDIDRGTKIVLEKGSISMEMSKKANDA